MEIAEMEITKMKKQIQTQKSSGGLDLFRLAAALLVIAIHTSPLASFSGGADFFLTRILARTAVPFFFMVTGHFILSELFTGRECPKTAGQKLFPARLQKYLLRLSLLYGAAILLYLPLGVYAGHYEGLTLGKTLRMLLFDGTFYHLWYFPACILGILLVWLFSRFLDLKGVTVISVLLYVVGLFGDSYFGLAEKVPLLSTAYNGMFQIFSYTRNGLFLAPVFLVLGIWAGQGMKKSPALQPPLRHIILLVLSFCIMTAEAFILRCFDLQRHDSMYLFLVPVMYFLYQCLLSVPVDSHRILRSAAMWIYLLHPAFIVVVRGAAKILKLTRLLVDNSLLHYLAVSFLSIIVGFAMACLINKITQKNSLLRKKHALPAEEAQNRENNTIRHGTERAWIELNLDSLEHNVRFLQSCLPDKCRLMPAVKADAYGHGADIIAKELNRLGIQDFCVACISEGISLRKAGVKGQILILGYTHPSQFPLLRRYRLTQTVVDYDYADELQKSGVKCHVHIAVDTGMHRLGIRCEELEQIASIYEMKNLSVDGIFTHLSASDSPASECRAFTESQIQAFYGVTDTLKSAGYACGGLHMLSSSGILNYPGASGDYARPGIALYGVLSTGNEQFSSLLRPVLSLKARVASVRTLQPGESAGYGLDFTARQETRLAVLAIGYADGLPRALSSGKGSVLIHGKKAPVIGRICMDQTLIDVSEIPDVSQQDAAVIIGESGSQKITAEELAKQCDTITNEILSRLGARLNRITV